MKIGDKIVCIDNKFAEDRLTLGKAYIIDIARNTGTPGYHHNCVIVDDNGHYNCVIVDDNGHFFYYSEIAVIKTFCLGDHHCEGKFSICRFISLKEYRKRKLNRICIE